MQYFCGKAKILSRWIYTCTSHFMLMSTKHTLCRSTFKELVSRISCVDYTHLIWKMYFLSGQCKWFYYHLWCVFVNFYSLQQTSTLHTVELNWLPVPSKHNVKRPRKSNVTRRRVKQIDIFFFRPKILNIKRHKP